MLLNVIRRLLPSLPGACALWVGLCAPGSALCLHCARKLLPCTAAAGTCCMAPCCPPPQPFVAGPPACSWRALPVASFCTPSLWPPAQPGPPRACPSFLCPTWPPHPSPRREGHLQVLHHPERRHAGDDCAVPGPAAPRPGGDQPPGLHAAGRLGWVGAEEGSRLDLFVGGENPQASTLQVGWWGRGGLRTGCGGGKEGFRPDLPAGAGLVVVPRPTQIEASKLLGLGGRPTCRAQRPTTVPPLCARPCAGQPVCQADGLARQLPRARQLGVVPRVHCRGRRLAVHHRHGLLRGPGPGALTICGDPAHSVRCPARMARCPSL